MHPLPTAVSGQSEQAKPILEDVTIRANPLHYRLKHTVVEDSDSESSNSGGDTASIGFTIPTDSDNVLRQQVNELRQEVRSLRH